MNDDTPSHPSVAVIIPNHLRITELRQAIISALDQTYDGDITVYVVYEPRRELERVRTELSEVVWIERPAVPDRASIAERRNVGLEQSSEDLVAFLDDDDIWHPDKLRRQVRAMTEVGAVACATGCVTFSAERGFSWPELNQGRVVTLSPYRIFRSGSFMTSSTLVDGATARALRMSDRSKWLGLDDYDFKLRLSSRGSMILLPDVLTALRTDAASDSRLNAKVHFGRALDVFATHFADQHSLAAWRALPVRLLVTALFPSGPTDDEALNMLRQALNGRLMGRLDPLVFRAISWAWRSRLVVPVVRKLIPERFLV